MAGPSSGFQQYDSEQYRPFTSPRYHPARTEHSDEGNYDFEEEEAAYGRRQRPAGQLANSQERSQNAVDGVQEAYESQPLYREYSGSEHEHGHYQQDSARRHNGGYHAAGAESDVSLPLYRSRSQSILEASQNLLPQSHTASSLHKRYGQDMPERTAASNDQNKGGQPTIRAVDFQTGQRFDNATSSTGTPSQSQAVEGRPDTAQSNASSKRHVDFAASVTQALNDVQQKSEESEKSPSRPGLQRTNSDWEDDEHNTTFDDYDWSDDDELVKQLDERYEKEYKEQIGSKAPAARRGTVIRRFSPVHLAKLLVFTFLGNIIAILILIAPALVLQIVVKHNTDDSQLVFACDNVAAWCFWIAFNLIAKWVIHAAFEFIPRLVVFVIELIWGDSNEKFRTWVEMFTASKGYIKPLFFAGFFWGSFAIIFNSIFNLRSATDAQHQSRAPYTYRIYQVVELLFFIALVYSIEKIIIRFISLQFHAVAFADRIKDNGFALATIDKLKDYRPKRRTRIALPGTPHSTREGAHYFGGIPMPRSATATPNPAFSRGSHNNSAPGTPTIPGMPEPAHTSVWSRLPIPAPFKAGHHGPSEAPIPLEMTSNLAQRRRQQTQDSAGSAPTPTSGGTTSGLATPGTPGTPGTPMTPGVIAEQMVTDGSRKKRKHRFFHRSGVSAQEIARQAMTDPLKTLQNPTLVKSGLSLDFANAGDAKKLARDLFYAFRQDTSRSYLITSDFYPAFPTRREAEAAFAVFDKDGNGDISRPEIRHTILSVYKERRFLARSLQDVSEAVSTLDRLFQVVGWIIIALIAFAVFNVNIWSNLTTAYTLVLAVSFIFKSTAQNIFDSTIFLFATHPYDTGDRLTIEGDVFVVKQLGLFSTLFTKWDGTETLIANSKLGQLPITNFRRSSPQFENATLQVGWSTTLEQLDALESKMNDWLARDEKRAFAPSTAVVVQSFNYMNWIELTVGMQHRSNWQDWGARWDNRTTFHAALFHYTKELGITFTCSPQPVQYWQTDLDEPIQEEEDLDDLDDLRSPLSPVDGANEIPAPIPAAQPLFGFLPPEGSKMRRRKGHSKKKNMSGVGA